MSNTPHELAEEFPDQIDTIRDLNSSNAHFAKITNEYHVVNRAVHRAETGVEPTSSLHETELRKQRIALKDEIAKMISEQVRG